MSLGARKLKQDRQKQLRSPMAMSDMSLGARKPKQDRQKQLRSPMAMSDMYEGEEFEDTKGVIRTCKSKDRLKLCLSAYQSRAHEFTPDF
jgi:endonuclease IV